MRFKAKNGASHEKIAPVRANQITGISSDLKMGVIEQNIAHNHARLTITILPCTTYTVIAAFPQAPLSLQVI